MRALVLGEDLFVPFDDVDLRIKLTIIVLGIFELFLKFLGIFLDLIVNQVALPL